MTIQKSAAATALLVALVATLAADPSSSEARVTNQRIFFGHQSVGDNILDGVRSAAPGLRILRGEAPPAHPGIVETLIGRNEDPDSKLLHFERVMASLGDRVDVAMMKFCYVDFSADTDTGALQQRYRDMMGRLTRRYRRTRFVHVTVPLTVVQTGPRAFIKRQLGRPVWGERENRQRDRFNVWLRQTYDREAIFDLAAIESTGPRGERVEFELEGRRYPMLFSGYSNDGGHLADDGRRKAAAGFLDLVLGLSAGAAR
jgi:hypothetical protein